MSEVLNIPKEIKCYNILKVYGIEAFSIFLKRFAYPGKYSDMISRFGRAIPQLSMISNKMLNILYDDWGHFLRDFNPDWLSPDNLQLYADAILRSGTQTQRVGDL